jgi:hypothetical protein
MPLKPRWLVLPGVASPGNLVADIVQFSHEDRIEGCGASVLNITGNVRKVIIDSIAPTELIETIEVADPLVL